MVADKLVTREVPFNEESVVGKKIAGRSEVWLGVIVDRTDQELIPVPCRR